MSRRNMPAATLLTPAAEAAPAGVRGKNTLLVPRPCGELRGFEEADLRYLYGRGADRLLHGFRVTACAAWSAGPRAGRRWSGIELRGQFARSAPPRTAGENRAGRPEADRRYLFRPSADRLLHGFRVTACAAWSAGPRAGRRWSGIEPRGQFARSAPPQTAGKRKPGSTAPGEQP